MSNGDDIGEHPRDTGVTALIELIGVLLEAVPAVAVDVVMDAIVGTVAVAVTVINGLCCGVCGVCGVCASLLVVRSGAEVDVTLLGTDDG